jgi:monofunctional biosynthetic peptidoglycan transglycosylase
MLRLLGKGLLLLAGLFLLMQCWYLAHVLWWKAFDPASTAFMEAGLERLQEKKPDAELRYRWVDYNRVSVHLKRAVIAAEDSRFLAHEGFDWEGIEKAVERNLRKGRIVAGGSTISQQLAKNLFLSASRNPFRKLQEAVITVMIETLWSKRRILEVYLNVIEWGNGIFGAEAASRRYFRVPASGLGPDQAADAGGNDPESALLRDASVRAACSSARPSSRRAWSRYPCRVSGQPARRQKRQARAGVSSEARPGPASRSTRAARGRPRARPRNSGLNQARSSSARYTARS